MNLAIDTSAGERERNSLALLLSHPVSTRNIVLAKVIAVTVFAMVGLLLTLIISKISYAFVPWQELGFTVSISTEFILLMLLTGLPIALMAASLQLFVSFMAKTFKEAQSYLTLVLIVPMMLSMAASYNIAPDILQWLPVSGQQQALIAFIKGRENPNATTFTLLIDHVYYRYRISFRHGEITQKRENRFRIINRNSLARRTHGDGLTLKEREDGIYR